MSGKALDPTVAFCDSAHGVEAPKHLATLETASVYEDAASVDVMHNILHSAAALRGPTPSQLSGFYCKNIYAAPPKTCTSGELVERARSYCSKCLAEKNYSANSIGTIKTPKYQHHSGGSSTLDLSFRPLESAQTLIGGDEYHEDSTYEIDEDLIQPDHD
ncbi:hypothetical protein ABVK25_003915 [Lepraria finkii]|uniref:Uncharacterized protein n=1 Tax=Lepraria finkii TaxID=1340010 RepID=A0ABR4BID4_9LECA